MSDKQLGTLGYDCISGMAICSGLLVGLFTFCATAPHIFPVVWKMMPPLANDLSDNIMALLPIVLATAGPSAFAGTVTLAGLETVLVKRDQKILAKEKLAPNI